MRLDLSYGFTETLLKENVDGEALEWAAGRIRAASTDLRDDEPGIVFISDGAPIDAATLGQNPSNYLKNHLMEVKGKVARDLPLAIVHLDSGVVHKPAPLHPEALVANPLMHGHWYANADKSITHVSDVIAQAIATING